jgi:putative NIF3 family GTP cyclohydrolase 1 type 2
MNSYFHQEACMKAYELQSYLRSLNGGWMDLENTVDTFKSGPPGSEVRGIAVSWMSYTAALHQALELGCNVFITHEPTYFDHFDGASERGLAMFEISKVRAKRQFIEDHDLIILRCHDLWDQMPQIGIPDAWANWLELGQAINGGGYFRIYDVKGRTAIEMAQQVAEHTQVLGQEAVQLIGPAEKSVSRLAIGTGAITPFLTFVEQYNADIAICTDDGFVYWRDGAFAVDMQIPVIIVNHTVSEEAGMINLAAHLQSEFPDIPVHHIPQHCVYRLIHTEKI